MKTKKIDKAVTVEKAEQTFYGRQLVRLEQYSDCIARTILKPDKLYSYEEADKLIAEYKIKKG